MTTKDQERQAIEKIRKIVEGLGENSYVGFAMEGVLELAEDNIREDTACSMKKRAEIAWERADKAEKENKDLKKTVEKRGATISELNTELCNARAEAKANEVPEELIQEMYCMAYDKEAESIGKMERAADQMTEATIAGEDAHGFAEEYKKQKENRNRWDVNERTKERIPSLPEDYLVSKEAEEILQMVDKTPARLFMLTGDAGTGKTTDARMIAQILGLPYYVFTCGPGTDELELLATTVPNMGGTAHLEMELPRLEDIEMDPASALATVNGIYEEGISREKAFQEILKAVYEKGYEKSKNEKDFLLKESEIVKACREPSVIEIQEPAMIEKPGTLTRLNSLFDDGAVTDLVNGEQIRRNPDTIVIMTTNLDYVGCQNFNQSVLSRMNLIQPKEALTEEEMAKRAMKRTGFKNKELLSFMAATVCKIHEYLIEQDITDGVCGYRELENWVLSYMVSNDLRRSAWTALLSKASMDREEQGTMERVFLLPHCAVD